MLFAPRLIEVTALLPVPPKKLLPEIVIVSAERFEPELALKPETTGPLVVIVNADDAVTALSDIPPSWAKAVMVALVPIVKGAVYIEDAPVGVVPSFVYLIVAPTVPVEIVTVTEFE